MSLIYLLLALMCVLIVFWMMSHLYVHHMKEEVSK